MYSDLLLLFLYALKDVLKTKPRDSTLNKKVTCKSDEYVKWLLLYSLVNNEYAFCFNAYFLNSILIPKC